MEYVARRKMELRLCSQVHARHNPCALSVAKLPLKEEKPTLSHVSLVKLPRHVGNPPLMAEATMLKLCSWVMVQICGWMRRKSG